MDWTKVGLGALRIFGAAVVTYVFAITLMTASAQNLVSEGLKSRDIDLSYSSARARAIDLESRRLVADARARDERAIAGIHDAAEFKLRELISESDAKWAELDAVLKSLAGREGCFDRDGPEPMAGWHLAVRCRDSDALSARERAQLDALLSQPVNARGLQEQRLAQQRVADRAFNQVQAVGIQLKSVREEVSAGRAIDDAFDDMDALHAWWLPGAAMLAAFPPILVQLVLAFASGLFGALLITLVLAVYPQSSLQFTAGDGFGARILLGGLIAVGVYVVVSGGAAVLGTEGAGAASTNIMTFCAIGILAGMFSDRVASWLSEKSDLFFARTGSGDKGRPQAPSPTVPASTGRP